MPAFIGRVFFSKQVSLPFLRFRMLRHGYLRCPLPWREVSMPHFKGIWIVLDDSEKPDVVVYYCHGGGFSMGSSYFYMEFLLAWVTLLRDAGFKNPALFALEYTLVPDDVYPTQVRQTFAGYNYVLSIIEDPLRVCVAGDSAGATLILSMLLSLTDHSEYSDRLPQLAVMISPWVTVISDRNRNTASDYLDQRSLYLYGSQYIGTKVSPHDPLASPGECKDLSRWKKASPAGGWFFLYGSEEVLAPECRSLIQRLKKTDVEVGVHEEQGSIHAWPVAALYLGETKDARLHGLQIIVKIIKKRFATLGKEYDANSYAKTKTR
jgi:acetyl esterase/lipase